MKKVLSLSLALLMLITSISSVTAFAKTQGTANLDTQINKAAEYVANDLIQDNSIAKVSYPDYWLLVDSGYDMDHYEPLFLAGLSNNLEKNGGKIVIEGTEWYQDEHDQWQSYSYSYEDIAVYAAVILTLDAMGYNPASFLVNSTSYDITAQLRNFDLSTITNPYSYRLATLAAVNVLGDKALAKKFADDMIERFYTMGQGMNYYGYSCDNTGHFLAALDPVADSYKKYVDDACKVIKSFTKSNGAYADAVYVPDVNADSTALAMLGYCTSNDVNGAYWYYQMLIDGFYNASTGAFKTNGADNTYATKDALLSLLRFKKLVATTHDYSGSQQVVTPADTKKDGTYVIKCPICASEKKGTIAKIASVTLSNTKYVYNNKAKTPKVTVKDANGKQIDKKYYTVSYSANKNVGTGKVIVKFSGRYQGTVTKNIIIKPKGTSVKSLKAIKKGVVVKWNKKTTQTTGYQIQCSRSKKFSKAKPKTVKDNKKTSKKITKLVPGKKYYVRVRTYKTVNGKTYYSKWSEPESVKISK